MSEAPFPSELIDPDLTMIERTESLFAADIEAAEQGLREAIAGARFLVIGGGGSIGQAVCREIFSRSPRAMHAVDLSENNLTELVRDLRSTLGYIEGDFQALPLDSASPEYHAFIRAQRPYDYILNLSALKHVRSEKDPYTLMRMVCVNILNARALAEQSARDSGRKFFCVSTDKAANPVNMMGASKRIMELFLFQESERIAVSLSRFANVAFSDGSLLHGFRCRFSKGQPIAAPRDVRRYFMTKKESGELCLLSCLLGHNREILFPKLSERLHPQTFSQLAERFVRAHGFEPHSCASESEARREAEQFISRRLWPCWFFDSDTTGEKEVEEFYTETEHPDFSKFRSIGVLRLTSEASPKALEEFEAAIYALRARGEWTKEQLVKLFCSVLPSFRHAELNKYLDGKM
jgi:FlaA1/EpsC-like NDP-sugar epimerase